jgi:hypothetical protein
MTPSQLKAALTLAGLRIDPSARDGARTVPDSIDLELPRRRAVSVPVVADGESTPYLLTARAGASFIEDAARATPPVPVRYDKPPRFYERTTSQGTPMGAVGSVRGPHLVLTPGGACGFGVRGAPCPFCLEGARASGARAAHLHPTEVVEVVRAATAERAVEAVYFNSAAFDAEDGGIEFIAPYVEAVRRHVDILVAVQLHPPASTAWVDRTYALGVDALSYNLEIFDPDVLLRQCVGRARYIGRERYLEVLAHAARVFPSGTVWSELVAGIEPLESTLAGIEALADAGVVPVLVMHRGGSAAANGGLLDGLGTLLARLVEAVERNGINPGWVQGLPLGISPLEAALDAGTLPTVATTIHHLSRQRPGAFVLRNLSRLRRRLRVRTPDDSVPGGH